MALNWVMLNESNQPIPLPNERTVLTIDKGADVVLEFPDAAGNSKKLKAIGRIWITELRFLFVADSYSGPPPFESLSVPLPSLLSTSFVQPTFSANYLAIDIQPSPQGGLSEGSKAEIRLKDQPMIGFVSTLEKVRERALYMKRESAMGEDLPVYSSRPVSTSGNSSVPRSATTSQQHPDAPPGYNAM